MTELRKFIMPALVFAALFLVLALGIEACVRHLQYPAFRALDRALARGVDIVYLGDSAVYYCGADDPDQRTIADMAAALLPKDVSILLLSQSAYHLGVYEAYVQHIARAPVRPRVLIVPLNLRSFSPSWDTKPGWQFDDEICILRGKDGSLLKRLTHRVGTVFSGSGVNAGATQSEIRGWHEQSVYCGSRRVGKVKDFEFGLSANDPDVREKTRRKFIYHYLSPLTPAHRRVKSLEQLLQNALAADIRVVLYVPPIDVTRGTELVGEEFCRIVDTNKQVLGDVARQHGSAVLDLSYDLSSACFSYSLDPNEHLNRQGKQHVAERLHEALLPELERHGR